MAKEKKNRRYSIKLKTITLTVALSVIVMETAVAYHAIMTNRNNKETYMAIAKDISSSVALVTDVEQFKELKANVKAIVDASSERPIAEEHSDEELAPYYAQFEDVKKSKVFKQNKKYYKLFAILTKSAKMKLYNICLTGSIIYPPILHNPR